jgi:hypothetical protein
VWLLGLLPLLAIAIAVAVFAALGGPGLGDRTGPPVEELAVERTVLHPGEIELTVRNDGADPVEIAQIAVNDGYAPFTADDGRTIARHGSTAVGCYRGSRARPTTVSLLTSTGGTVSTRSGRRQDPRPTRASSA